MLLAGVVVPARAELASDCPIPSHVYLGNNPDGTDWPDWSENAQGIANDGKLWFFTSKSGGLFMYATNWEPIDGDDIGKFRNVGFPLQLKSIGIDHFGDPDYYAGYVFVPFEGNHRAVIAAFRASNLGFVDWVDVSAFQPKAGWVAIDPVERILYTSDDHINADAPLLLRYEVDVSKLENGIPGDFLTPTTPIAVREADGSPVSGEFNYMQGGVFTPWGDLYLAVGRADVAPDDVRGGIHLFRRTSDGSAFRLIASSVNVSGHVGDGVFAYEYHPNTVITVGGEEPEGLDWWNRDNVPDSPYSGQLHAILLDNQLGDDQIWLKHYRVDYFCVGDADSDGVADEEDRCPGTSIPDPVIPSSGVLKKNRYSLLDDDFVFDGGDAAPPYTAIETGGCNASQIADALGLGQSHYEYGITRSVLDAWIGSQP
jgi:hypothetical protein